MSKYTDFFPLAGGGGGGGGSTEITDPDKIAKITLANDSASYMKNMFYTTSAPGGPPTAGVSGGSNNGYFGTSAIFRSYGGGPVKQTANNTEITLANVTNGSGYLCCVVTPIGAYGTTQEIKITVDGGTEKVYTFDYSTASPQDESYTRLVWGFSALGSYHTENYAYNPNNSGILGMGATGLTWNNFLLPPHHLSNSTYSPVRLFNADEFKMYQLPRLRFESSILVKCKTTTLYSTTSSSDWVSQGTAIYYLDNQSI